MKKLSYFLPLFIVAIIGCSEDKREADKGSSEKAVAPIMEKFSLFPVVPPVLGQFPFVDGGQCYVDLINNKKADNNIFSIKPGSGFSIAGWAIDEKKQNSPEVVVLKLAAKTQSYYSLLSRYDRPDLVKGAGKPEYLKGGYTGQVNIGSLPSGEYEIQLVQKTTENNLVCSTNRKLVLQ